MPQVSVDELQRVPLRVHEFLADVPLHDVWAIDLPRVRRGITLDEFLRAGGARPSRLPFPARALFSIRLAAGRLFGWDRKPPDAARETFATRLTAADRSRSLAPAGSRDGFFRIVYRFDNEQLSEEANRIVHAAALSALVETAATYRFYFAVYVRAISPFTRLYLAAIEPFRAWIVYPALLRAIRDAWNRSFGAQ